MYDLHSHIIWSVDDGSKNIDMSHSMIRTAAETGTKAIFATSHIIEKSKSISWELMLERCKELNEWAQNEHLDITIYPGGEIYMNWDLLPHLTKTKDYRLAESSYMLVEFPMREIPTYVEEFFYHLRVAGVKPILAHPERYASLLSNPDLLMKWRREGLYLQVNGGSLTGFYGNTVQKRAHWLLANNLIDVIGSDAHSTEGRTTDLTAARQILRELTSEDTYQRLTNINPQCIIKNKEIDVVIPKTLTKLKLSKPGKKSFWQKLFG